MTLVRFPFLSNWGAYQLLELGILLSMLAVGVSSVLVFLIYKKNAKIEHNLDAVMDHLRVALESDQQ